MEKCKGIIEKIVKGKDVPGEWQGKPTISANYSIFINGDPYVTFTNVRAEMPFKEGDEVEITYTDEMDNYGNEVKKFKMKDGFINLTSPVKQGGFGGVSKWVPDPAKDLRICYQSVFSHIMPAVIHNHSETKITEDSIKQALKWSEAVIKRMYSFKIDIPTAVATTSQPATIAPKKSNERPTEEQPPMIDDDMPF